MAAAADWDRGNRRLWQGDSRQRQGKRRAPDGRHADGQHADQSMASQMIDAMGADMMTMHTAPDGAWSALSDSVRRDLAACRDSPARREWRRTWSGPGGC